MNFGFPSKPGEVLGVAVVLLSWVTIPGHAQTGFPFTGETLKYSINWPSGLSLGEATFAAAKTNSGWSFDATTRAGVPGFSLSDTFHSRTTAELCSIELTRDLVHGSRETSEKTTFDSQKGSARRTTTFPEGGGSTDMSIGSCARDALAFVYFVRREMGQGRVAPPDNVFFGGAYSVRLEYTGAMTITAGGKQAVADHVNASIRGPKASLTVEIFFDRDAARTPLLIRIPLAISNVSVELVR
jgi:hypothetical protein